LCFFLELGLILSSRTSLLGFSGVPVPLKKEEETASVSVYAFVSQGLISEGEGKHIIVAIPSFYGTLSSVVHVQYSVEAE
jgi:hypothetical protein